MMALGQHSPLLTNVRELKLMDRITHEDLDEAKTLDEERMNIQLSEA